MFDPTTNQWTTKAPLPRERWSGAGVAIQGKLYVIGGLSHNTDGTLSVLRTTSVYDPAVDTWTKKAPLPSSLDSLTGSRVVLNGEPRIEVMVGNTNLQYLP